ncbi:pyruvoyl-dependent arginine decarboxylase [Halobacteriales archaeon SW_10_68_16]|jgi:arginine decarboxylase|nr:MAG: pyruvoyl-dependent arginine decarboxylase [Halobacteriales archaeon SW_10_68_16]
MSAIRVVWGTGAGPTATSAYDAALADAGVHNYNLVTLSSVIPADVPLEVAGTAPDLGPAGNRLAVVQGRGTAGPEEENSAVAGLGWARDESGRGIFYEAGGTEPEAVRATIEEGLQRGQELREWDFVEGDVVVREAPGEAGPYPVAVVCAVYGESAPLVGKSAGF